MGNEVLYNDDKLKVVYNSKWRGNGVIDCGDYELWLGNSKYILQSGVLRDLALYVREGDDESLISDLDILIQGIHEIMYDEGIDLEDLVIAFAWAYDSEEAMRDDIRTGRRWK